MFVATVLLAALLTAASATTVSADSLVGVWLSGRQQLVLRADRTWSAHAGGAQQHHGNWHVADGKLIQTDWSRSATSAIIWDVLGADGQTLKLRLIETDQKAAKRYDMVRTFKRADDPRSTPRPNQAMQLTASKPAVYAWSVCRRNRMLRSMHTGLAAADLVSR